ncbi:MAG TPA: A/G-specific adenine glycosylase [Spirochaetota bacterium]|nr:A/G-specific adenine glycosylase [Spirochaetota bacterium]
MDALIKKETRLIQAITENGFSKNIAARFRSLIYSYYNKEKRPLPWRDTRDPYHILVSEIMLQQTQVSRVIGKYTSFIDSFPDITALASASGNDVLRAWQGLGYNRRALALHNCAKTICREHSGVVPDSPEILMTLPGIGKATAASIAVYAYNIPAAFIETNIRTVFIHFFFSKEDIVHDKTLLPLVEKAIDRENPSRWFNALMDYGVMLKKREGNISRRSTQYRPQSAFSGSRRELRGKIIKILIDMPMQSVEELSGVAGFPRGDISSVLEELQQEGFIVKDPGGRYSITK